MDISVNKDDEQKNLKFNKMLNELNIIVENIEKSNNAMNRNNSIIEYCILDIRNKNKVIVLQIIEETLNKIWELSEIYCNDEMGLEKIIEHLKIILFNYNLGLNALSDGGLNYNVMVTTRFNIYNNCKEENSELYKLKDNDKALWNYCNLICTAELYWEFIFTFEVLVSDNDMVAAVIPSRLRYKLVRLLYNEMSNVLKELQRCLRTDAMSIISIELGNKKNLKEVLMDSIDETYSIIFEKGTSKIDELRDRLNIEL